MTLRYWVDLPATVFDGKALCDHIAVLPLGAIEQHGPHLPLGTDSSIAQGMLDAVAGKLADAARVLFLPLLEVTNSVEHTNRPGTLSLGRDLTFRLLVEVARSVSRAGVRKLVIVNAHGGNVGAMVDASHTIRAELGMLCVVTNWMRLGLPDGVIRSEEKAIDIHGGQLETAIMLALRPDLVSLNKAERFSSLQSRLSDDFELLRAYGPVGFGWMGNDLDASGAVGDATKGDEEDGARIIAYQAERMVCLLDEVARFQPDWFV